MKTRERTDVIMAAAPRFAWAALVALLFLATAAPQLCLAQATGGTITVTNGSISGVLYPTPPTHTVLPAGPGYDLHRLEPLPMPQEESYTNATSYLGQHSDFGNQFGDQIFVKRSCVVKTFKLEYYLSRDVNSNETARVRFYRNDGADRYGTNMYSSLAPGSLLYDSGVFSIPSGQRTVTIGDLLPLNIKVPSWFTWTVEFSGVEGSEQVGLMFYNPPTAGFSHDDCWVLVGGASWTLFNIEGVVANFGAEVTTVPLGIDIGLRVFDGTATVSIACEPPGQDGSLISPVGISKNGTNYGIVLVETNSPDASKIQVQTSSGINAWQKLP